MIFILYYSLVGSTTGSLPPHVQRHITENTFTHCLYYYMVTDYKFSILIIKKNYIILINLHKPISQSEITNY